MGFFIIVKLFEYARLKKSICDYIIDRPGEEVLSMKKVERKLMLFVLSLGVIFSGKTTCFKADVVHAEETKQVVGLGSDGIKSPDPGELDKSWTGSFIWYGKYDDKPLRYRVLDLSTTIFTSQSNPTIFLDCDKVLYKDNNKNNMRITEENKHLNSWINNSIRAVINDEGFYNKSGVFTKVEKQSIAASSISEHSITIDSKYTKLHPTYTALDNDYIFLLDYEDIINSAYGYNTDCDPAAGTIIEYRRKYMDDSSLDNLSWWTRTPATMKNYNILYSGGCDVFSDDGDIGSTFDSYYEGISPAFNVNLSNVLYSSLVSGKAGENYAEYKLTLVDDDLKVSIPTDSLVDISGESIKIPYSVTGNDSDMATQISVLVLDKEYTPGNTNSAKILYYDKLITSGTFSKNGEGEFSLPFTLASSDLGKSYHVYLIAEQINGTYESDYASVPVEITRDMVDVPYELWVGNTQVMSSNSVSIPCGSGTVSYDSNVNKLTFDNVTGIIGNSTVGENSVKIYSKIDNLTISGKAVIDGADIGIYSEKSIIFDNVDIAIKGENSALSGREMVLKSGEIKAECSSNSSVNVGGLKVEGGKLSAVTNTAYDTSAIIAADHMTVNGGEVYTESDGKDSSGIVAGTLELNGGIINIQSYGISSAGLYFDNSLTVNDGKLYVTVIDDNGLSSGIVGKRDISKLEINGGDVKVSADKMAMEAKGGISLGEKMLISLPKNAKVSEDGTTILKSDNKTLANDVTISVKTFSINYNLNGKSGKAPEIQTISYGDIAKKPTEPSFEGWIFGGWYTSSSCKDIEKYDFASPVTENITLYAKWIADDKDKNEKPAPSDALPTKNVKDIYGNKLLTEKAKEKQILSLKGDKDVTGSTYSILQAKQKKATKSSITLSWKKVKGASKYIIYGGKCGKATKYKKLKTVKNTSFTQKKLKNGTYYKYIVVAVGDGKALATSKTLHISTSGGKKGNVKIVKVKKAKLSLKKGKTSKINASAVAAIKNHKVEKHRVLSFETSDPNVASVSKNGKIKAISKGKCKIYVYSQNGIAKTIEVTVK